MGNGSISVPLSQSRGKAQGGSSDAAYHNRSKNFVSGHSTIAAHSLSASRQARVSGCRHVDLCSLQGSSLTTSVTMPGHLQALECTALEPFSAAAGPAFPFHSTSVLWKGNAFTVDGESVWRLMHRHACFQANMQATGGEAVPNT